MEREAARRWGGARSPTSGSMICGVTVVMETRKERAVKVRRFVVRQRPSLGVWLAHQCVLDAHSVSPLNFTSQPPLFYPDPPPIT